MSKHATIVIHSPEEMADKLAELAKVLHNLRYWTKYWKQVYGSRARAQKEIWEQRADQLLDELGLSSHNDTLHTLVPRIKMETN